jgi:indole-3-glycerol phosphate synthase
MSRLTFQLAQVIEMEELARRKLDLLDELRRSLLWSMLEQIPDQEDLVILSNMMTPSNMKAMRTVDVVGMLVGIARTRDVPRSRIQITRKNAAYLRQQLEVV